ncbi:MAG: hypothetical protein V4773_22660 [Verrucomicrobiota bacterium]
MKLVWHIVAKDMRRLRLPWAVWMVFVVGSALYFALHPGVEPRGPEMWLRVANSFALVGAAAQFFVGFVLTGVLILEDAVIGTEVFWATRPVGRARLLAAKVIAAMLLFVVAPTVGLMPVWWAAGFNGGEVFAATVEAVVKHGLVTVVALGMGGLSSSLAGFLFASVAVAIGHILCGAYFATVWLTGEGDGWVRYSRSYLIQAAILPGLVILIVHQYLPRNQKRGWVLVAVFLAATLTVRLAWPWDIVPRSTMRGPLVGDDPVTQSKIAERAIRFALGQNPGEAHMRIVGEMRIREGETIASDANRVKILEIVRRRDGAPASIILEERDAWLELREGWGSRALTGARSRADLFILRTRTPQGVQAPYPQVNGVAVLSSIMTSAYWLTIPEELSEEALEGAVLIKVRYEKE